MSSFGLLGIDTGTITASIDAGPISQSEALLIEKPTATSQDALHFLTNKNAISSWPGLSTCAAGDSHFNQLGFGVTPPVFRLVVQQERTHSHRLYLNHSLVTNYELMSPTVFKSGTAHIYHISNGVFERKSVREIVGGKPGKWVHSSSSEKFVETTRFEFRLSKINLAKVDWPFRVRAINAAGEFGHWSELNYFLESAQNGGAVSNAVATSVPLPTFFNSNVLAPTNFRVDLLATDENILEFEWDPVQDAVAYEFQLSYQDSAEIADDNVPFFETVGGDEEIKQGDLIVVEALVLDPTPDMIPRRVSRTKNVLSTAVLQNVAGNLNPHQTAVFRQFSTTDPNPDDGDIGNFYIRRFSKAHSTYEDGYVYAGGSGQGYYKVIQAGEVYRLDFWCRSDSNITLQVDFHQPGVEVKTVAPTEDWKKYSLICSPSQTISGNSAITLNFNILVGENDANIDIAGIRLYDSKYQPFDNPLEADVPNGVWFRDHVNIKKYRSLNIGTHVDDLLAPSGNGLKGSNLQTVVDIAQGASNFPWFQLELYVTKEEWEKIIGWLAEKTTSFSKFRIELGNEVWQNHPAFWNLRGMEDAFTARAYSRGEVYGLYYKMVYTWWTQHPSWGDIKDKMEIYIGGRSVTAYGAEAYEFFPEATHGGASLYNGGWDNGADTVTEIGADYQNILQTPFAVNAKRAEFRSNEFRNVCEHKHGKEWGADFAIDQYEMMNGFAISKTISQGLVENIVLKSRAGTTAVADLFLSQAAQGSGTTFFSLGRGGGWSSHNQEIDGGGMNCNYAFLKAISNSIAPATAYEWTDIKVTNQAVSTRHFGTVQTPNVYIYALNSDQRQDEWLFVVGNRNINASNLDTSDPLYDATDEGLTSILIGTPFKSASQLSICKNIGNMREHDNHVVGFRRLANGSLIEDPLCVDISYEFSPVALPNNLARISLDEAIGITAGGLRGGESVLLKFEGVNL